MSIDSPKRSSQVRWVMTSTFDPVAVVQRQLEAFNAQDIEALLAAYANNAEMFEHPSTLLARGTEQLRTRFTARFLEPNLHAALLHRAVAGNKVMDHELVTRTFPEGPGTIELIMIYEVVEDRIARAWSIAGEKNLHERG